MLVLAGLAYSVMNPPPNVSDPILNTVLNYSASIQNLTDTIPLWEYLEGIGVEDETVFSILDWMKNRTGECLKRELFDQAPSFIQENIAWINDRITPDLLVGLGQRIGDCVGFLLETGFMDYAIDAASRLLVSHPNRQSAIREVRALVDFVQDWIEANILDRDDALPNCFDYFNPDFNFSELRARFNADIESDASPELESTFAGEAAKDEIWRVLRPVVKNLRNLNASTISPALRFKARVVDSVGPGTEKLKEAIEVLRYFGRRFDEFDPTTTFRAKRWFGGDELTGLRRWLGSLTMM
jgi:hypothetical protein